MPLEFNRRRNPALYFSEPANMPPTIGKTLIYMTSLTCLVFLPQMGCDTPGQQAKMAQLKAEVVRAKAEAFKLQKEQSSAKLVHCVWFQLKDGSDDKQELMDGILKLREIEQVRDLEVGNFHDLSDPRAMSDYQLFMQMRFENDHDYHLYQEHPIHLALKETVKKFLAGPPKTYDYMAIMPRANGDLNLE